MIRALLPLVLATGVPAAAPRQPIKSAEQLIHAMRAKYPNWYRKLSFVQRVIYGDGRPEGEWWEAALLPGRLRIDFAPVDSGNGAFYRGDSVYAFKRGKITAAKQRNILLVMAFDVYLEDPARTIAVVKEEGFDFAKFREAEWKGIPFYVIGDQGNELWVEKDRLLLHRVIETGADKNVSDISFDKFDRLGEGWLGTVVVFLRNGKEFFREVYRDWKINEAVTEDLFDSSAWKRPAWVPAR